jgi:RHS repeat-associated protein
MKTKNILLLTLVLILGITYAHTQTPSRDSEKGFVPGVPYASSDIENVNLTNGNLGMSFPLGSLPAGRGGASSGLFLRYNSKLWSKHIENITEPDGEVTRQYFLGDDPWGGWNYGANYSLLVTHRNDGLDEQVVPCTLDPVTRRLPFITHIDGIYVTKVQIEFPDGSKHEFWPAGFGIPSTVHGRFFNITPTGQITNFSSGDNCTETTQISAPYVTYYSVDGAGIQLKTYPNLDWELSMPDGSKITNTAAEGQRIYDRNGNYVRYEYVALPDGSSALGWVDEFGRYVARKPISPDEDGIYQLGTNGQLLTTKVRWKTVTVMKKYETECADCTQTRGQTSFQVLYMLFRVVDNIETPNGLTYTFDYYAHDGEVPFDPNGGTTNQNWSPGWGEIKSLTMPSSAKSEYNYKIYEDPSILILGDHIKPKNVTDTSGRTTQKTLSYTEEYDGVSVPKQDIWKYSSGFTFGSVIGPDGRGSTQGFYHLDNDENLGGYVYKTTTTDGAIAEKRWLFNNPSGFDPGKPVNPYVKTEYQTNPDSAGNPSLTAIKDFNYDKNGNVIEVAEYDWVSYSSIPRDQYGRPSGIPSGITPSRTTKTAFYNPTPVASDSSTISANSYWNPSAPRLRSLVSATETQDSSGAPRSRSEVAYDFINYDGGNTKGGNPTLTQTWDSFKNGQARPYSNPLTATNSISSSSTYNQYGMPLTTTDANGVVTQITYGNVVGPTGTVTDLYPTQTVSAFQTSTARTSSSVYDFYTGLVTTATDVDNNVSVVTEYDAFGRPTKVRSAAGIALESWTRTEYDDVNRRVVVRSDLETVGDGKKVATQFYDQLGRVRLSKTLEDAATQSPYNETDGIKVQTRHGYNDPTPTDFTDPQNTLGSYTLTSNPYRATSVSAAGSEQTMGWTLSYTVKTGRHSDVTTFSGAALPAPWGSNANSTGVVATDIDANTTTSTDEAGKQRRTVEDALDRLIRVDEPDENGNLSSVSSPTNYTYDALGNLTQITQGGQTRSFTYSSLSRLLSATNPESGTFQYAYDPNGNLLTKTDARGISTTHTYDALNRVSFRNYSDSTPDITYTYDDTNIPFSKGKLTKVSSTVSETQYLVFDAQGRTTSSRQITDGQNYTFGYTYKLDGDLRTQTYPSGKVVTFDYDSSGDLAAVAGQTGQIQKTYASAFAYAPHGQVERMRLGNGKWETTQFNSSRQITQIGLGQSATDTGLWKVNYEYGDWNGSAIDPLKNNGNLARQTITIPTIGATTGFTAVQSYTYDKLDRLKSATETIGGNQTWKQTFLFDRFGNKNFDSNPANTTIFSTESLVPKVSNPEVLQTNNRFKEDQDGDGQPDYLYDPSGNITKNARSQDFTYDAENRQVTAISNNLSVSYAYDGNGERIKSYNTVTNQTTIFVYDASGQLAAEYTINVPAPTNPTISYTTEDALGSPRVITNSFGEVKSRRDFLPFGEELYAGIANRNSNQKYSSNSDDTRQKFTGYQRDSETGLDFAQSRYYSPMQGRFTSPDEFKGGPDELFDFEDHASNNPTFYADLTNPQSLNKYQYSYNNPYKFNDPTGHCPPCDEDEGIGPAVSYLKGVGSGIVDSVKGTVDFATGMATNPRQTVSGAIDGMRQMGSNVVEMARDPVGTARATGDAISTLGWNKSAGIVGNAVGQVVGAVLQGKVLGKGVTAVRTEIAARTLVRTVRNEAAVGGLRPGLSAKPIRASTAVINRAGKIWTSNGRPLAGRSGQVPRAGRYNSTTGRTYRAPTWKTNNNPGTRVANFEQKKPYANVHVEEK